MNIFESAKPHQGVIKSRQSKSANFKNYSRTIGVFYGSTSAEHGQSVSTAKLVTAELSKLGFNVVLVFLDKDANWFIKTVPQDDTRVRVVFTAEELKEKKNWTLHLNHKGRLVFSRPKGLTRENVAIDIAMPLFHGVGGEDGVIQGVCKLLDVPYIGNSVATSALALDKVLAKDVFIMFELPTKPHAYFSKKEFLDNSQELRKYLDHELRFPLYVKPARQGSSIGISELRSIEDLDDCLATAFKYDDKVLVEESVQMPIDISIAVTGNYFDPDKIEVSKPIVTDRSSGEQTMFQTSNPEFTKLQKLAKQAFVAFEATGFASVDIIKDGRTGNNYLTEIDSIPQLIGLPLWEVSNTDSGQVLRELIRLADQNFEYQRITSKN